MFIRKRRRTFKERDSVGKKQNIFYIHGSQTGEPSGVRTSELMIRRWVWIAELPKCHWNLSCSDHFNYRLLWMKVSSKSINDVIIWMLSALNYYYIYFFKLNKTKTSKLPCNKPRQTLKEPLKRRFVLRVLWRTLKLSLLKPEEAVQERNTYDKDWNPERSDREKLTQAQSETSPALFDLKRERSFSSFLQHIAHH